MLETSRPTNSPPDYKEKIIEMKRYMRNEIGDVNRLFDEVCLKLEDVLAEAKKDDKVNGAAWPEITQDNLGNGNISEDFISLIKKRGCLIVRQDFPQNAGARNGSVGFKLFKYQ